MTFCQLSQIVWDETFCLQPGVAISAVFTVSASITELNSPIEICSVFVKLSLTELNRSEQHVSKLYVHRLDEEFRVLLRTAEIEDAVYHQFKDLLGMWLSNNLIM